MSNSTETPDPDKLFAFWKYDLPPYVTGTKGRFENEWFVSPSYGKLDPTKLVAVYPRKKGEEIKSALELIKTYHDQAVREARDKARKSVVSILPQMKDVFSRLE